MSTAGTPSRLSRERIVVAALEYIDEHGPQQLTMRKLGTVLGVEGMALYRHVEGREALLEAVVRHLMADVTHELDAELGATWQGYLQDIAHRIRGVAQRHPQAFPLVATRHPAAPWICPPIRDLDLIEHFLSTLRGQGLSGEQAVQVYQAFSSFLLGHLLLEVIHAGSDLSPVEMPLNEGDAEVSTEDEELDLSEFPTVQALTRSLRRDTSQEQFEIGLETLIDRLEMNLSQ